ncbi:MAG TPA: plastocyanin [Cyanothece sp. UBA12306]|nr:plastocyanin [Cyanothece sp. UBA12306]
MSKKLGLLFAAFVLVVSSFFVAVNPASAATVEVKMGADKGNPLGFEPKEITISSGDTVKWVNNKMAPHNVVVAGHEELSHKGMFFKSGEAFEATFTEPGEYDYWCDPHRGAGMVGKVVVK